MVSHTPHMVQVSWGCTCHDGARRSICCNCHISSQYNSLYLSLYVFVLGIMTTFMFPLCEWTFDVCFFRSFFKENYFYSDRIYKKVFKKIMMNPQTPWNLLGVVRQILFVVKFIYFHRGDREMAFPQNAPIHCGCPTPSAIWTWQHRGRRDASSAHKALWC